MSELLAPTLYDVVIVGAGPCGLAIAARLKENNPSALFTDDEHQRYHWIRSHSHQANIKNSKTGRERRAAPIGKIYSTLVIDGSGEQWLTRWKKNFETFDISHLRSPMFFHIDPADRDSLVAFAQERHREEELVEIENCVGKEVSKHHRKQKTKSANKQYLGVGINERDRQDYFLPSTSLFASHCDCIAEKYGLQEGLIKQAEVLDVKYRYIDDLSNTSRTFEICTSKGLHYARTVVLAIGPGEKLSMPGPMPGPTQLSIGQCHSMNIQTFPDPRVVSKMAAKIKVNIMVIGGGLTSAQLTDLAVRRGATKVWHLTRGTCKVKPFDVDLEWMGKYRNVKQASFWSADTDEERLEQIKAARGGGSLTPAYYKILKKHIATGRVSLHQHMTICEKDYNVQTESWTVRTEPPIPDLPRIDYIYYATGAPVDFQSTPILQSILKEYPIHGHAGLPCVNDDLMWNEDVPLFVTGRLAGLRLGPGAGNLGGARIGAERIAWSIGELLGDAKHAENTGLASNLRTDDSNRYLSLMDEDATRSSEE